VKTKLLSKTLILNISY